uniref:Immunoglobulin C1-set domain-containing protein n=1 Tax=Sinocyclocheilus rhinocerous TaxID=307959 RepID=A0A673ISE9_9TELE
MKTGSEMFLLIALLLFSAPAPPDVYIFARKAPDDHSKLVLICLAAGFYPRDIEMNIRLNRINIEKIIMGCRIRIFLELGSDKIV